MSVLLSEMTWLEVREAVERNALLVLPTGAIEQHGPHLPLGTDTYLPTEIVLRVAETVDCLVAPPLHYGYKSRTLSGGGQGFIGTTSLRGSTYIDVTRDVLCEFLRHGFKRLAIVNWHMENDAFLYEGADLALKETPESDARIMLVEDAWPPFTEEEMGYLFGDAFTGWDVEHASVVETSLMMALFPHLVRERLIADDASEEHPRYDLLPPPARLLSRSGVLSRATLATEEKGRFLVRRTVEYVAGLFLREFPDLSRS